MKTKTLKLFIITLLISIFTSMSIFAYEGIFKTTVPYLTLEQDVYYPMSPKGQDNNGKYPVVFMMHNGYADKAAWGDFPQDIAIAGFFTVNISWKAWDISEVETAINYTLEKYADQIDTNRVAFVGGCHGGRDALEIMNKVKDKYKVKTAVLLAVSEIDAAVEESQKGSHVPMLAYYSLKDEFGTYWGDMSKKVAEEVLTQPKKVVVLDETAHGNNIVTNASCKEDVRKEIVNWLKEHNK